MEPPWCERPERECCWWEWEWLWWRRWEWETREEEAAEAGAGTVAKARAGVSGWETISVVAGEVGKVDEVVEVVVPAIVRGSGARFIEGRERWSIASRGRTWYEGGMDVCLLTIREKWIDRNINM